MSAGAFSRAFRAQTRPFEPWPEYPLPFLMRDTFDVHIAVEKLFTFLNTPSCKETHSCGIVVPALDVRLTAVVEERHEW